MTIDTRKSPLVILVFDALDPDFVTGWSAGGYMPTLAALMERGFWSRMQTSEQIFEHGCWLSFLSGVPQSEHGYFDFRRMQPGSYDLHLVSPVEVPAPPFWSFLKETDKKVAILDAPEVDVVRGLPGIQLLNWASHQPCQTERAPAAEPAQLMQEVRRLFGPQMRLPAFLGSGGSRRIRAMPRRFQERIEKKGALCRQLLQRDQYDLVVLGFYEAHTAAHLLWDDLAEDQKVGEAVGEGDLSNALREIYTAIDREMGLLLAQLPPEANVCVVSLYGMKDQYPMTGISEALCRRLGFQVPPPPASPSLQPLDLARYLLPESLRVAVSRRLPPLVQERLLADWFRNSTDWNRTTAFAIPSLYTNYIRINLRDREPQGRVERGSEYRELLDRLETEFRRIVDPESRETLVNDVIRVADRLRIDPPAWLPDLLVEWHPSKRFIERALHPDAELTQGKPSYFRSSYHVFQGFLAVAGPNIRGLPPRDVSLLDLAPTFLSLLGQPVPEGMVGQVTRPMISG